jgi:hypothetical protein
MFVGVIDDWKKRVVQYAERKAPPQKLAEARTPETAAPIPSVSSALNLAQLRRNMLKALDDDELADLCFDMEVDYDSLPGASPGERVDCFV